jgi:hypothetical protein
MKLSRIIVKSSMMSAAAARLVKKHYPLASYRKKG